MQPALAPAPLFVCTTAYLSIAAHLPIDLVSVTVRLVENERRESPPASRTVILYVSGYRRSQLSLVALYWGVEIHVDFRTTIHKYLRSCHLLIGLVGHKRGM
jgi:hypothetical protein